ERHEAKGAHAGRLVVQLAIEAEDAADEGRDAKAEHDVQGVGHEGSGRAGHRRLAAVYRAGDHSALFRPRPGKPRASPPARPWLRCVRAEPPPGAPPPGGWDRSPERVLTSRRGLPPRRTTSTTAQDGADAPRLHGRASTTSAPARTSHPPR